MVRRPSALSKFNTSGNINKKRSPNLLNTRWAGITRSRPAVAANANFILQWGLQSAHQGMSNLEALRMYVGCLCKPRKGGRRVHPGRQVDQQYSTTDGTVDVRFDLDTARANSGLEKRRPARIENPNRHGQLNPTRKSIHLPVIRSCLKSVRACLEIGFSKGEEDMFV